MRFAKPTHVNTEFATAAMMTEASFKNLWYNKKDYKTSEKLPWKKAFRDFCPNIYFYANILRSSYATTAYFWYDCVSGIPKPISFHCFKQLLAKQT